MAGFLKIMSDLSTVHNTCSATKCQSIYKENRHFHREAGLWEIVMCYKCGLYGTHRVCSFLELYQLWHCKACKVDGGIQEERLSSQKRGMAIQYMDAYTVPVLNASVRVSERRTCNIEKCLCPHKENRKYQNKIGSWEILLCSKCGISATHRICSFVKCFQPWCCRACQAKRSRNH
ncbi:uncharacterized protein LOC132937245 [Metopolophium dirhodum]|uniref:uncharacterized protein LOC132937245 n=1 Tax=Metopolophium dirhodum TaxID=44670 RepID=UPI00298FA307|nr:uncharacterized protein LOC132937245 [Metopolophium dirhodum]